MIVPLVPAADHPAIAQLVEMVSWGEGSPLGNVEQITLEREQADRSREAVLFQLARDVTLLRQFIGKYALLGMDSLDYWNQRVNERVLHNELKKLDAAGKRRLIDTLASELGQAAQ